MKPILGALIAAHLLGAAPPPDEADAGARPDVAAPAPRPCTRDAAGARDAVTRAFADLVRAYDEALPGPRGQRLMKREVDRLITSVADVEGFTRATVRDPLDEATPEQRARWQTILARMLHKRYRPKLKDPRGHTLTLLGADLDCDEARVRANVQARRRAEVTRLELRLRLVPGRGWKAWDVTIDGASLVRTWRKRFATLYAEGGLGALERYFVKLAERYPCEDEGCPR